jgi:hypothetical protein
VTAAAVRLIHEGTFGACAQVVKEIQDARGNFEEIGFCDEGRRTNGEAHRSARSSILVDSGRHVWFVTPLEGLHIMFCLICNKGEFPKKAVGTGLYQGSKKTKNYNPILGLFKEDPGRKCNQVIHLHRRLSETSTPGHQHHHRG